MSTVSAPPRRAELRRRPPPRPPSATGNAPLHLSIGGTRYRLHPLTPPAGFKAVWSLRKQIGRRPRPSTRSPSRRARQPACTCPDHEINGAVCKHIGALKALGLIPGRKARPAAARRSHARRLAESPAPAPSALPERRRLRRRRRRPGRRPVGPPGRSPRASGRPSRPRSAASAAPLRDLRPVRRRLRSDRAGASGPTSSLRLRLGRG